MSDLVYFVSDLYHINKDFLWENGKWAIFLGLYIVGE